MDSESQNDALAQEKELLASVADKGAGEKVKTYAKLCGPGWLQSAITLGGGSLVGALGLGVIGGTGFMWVQPVAMILGVIMLSAIAYVTLSTGERPFQAINSHVSPVLGWGWLVATMLANMIWCLPQFNLAFGAVTSNLAPDLVSDPKNNLTAKIIISGIVLGIATLVIWSYGTGSKGVKLFENILKALVGLIVLSFIGVVIALTFAEGSSLKWGEVFAGFVPDLSALFKPAPTFQAAIDQLNAADAKAWTETIASKQRDTIITAVGTAVGINMTFLLPYSMLRKGWNRDFRGLAIFDLSTGLLIPFMLATGCVVISAASQFHATPAAGFLGEKDENGALVEPAKNLVGPYNGLLAKRVKADMTAEELAAFDALSEDDQKAKLTPLTAALPVEEKTMAAMLVKRDAFNLAATLEPLVGKTVSQYVFGFGVLGMALNAATMLMLINGLCWCELRNRAPKGMTQRIGSLMVCVGILGPFLWTGDAKMWLAVPTSVFAMVLLPIAYVVFALMMNNKTILGKDMPTGRKRIVWNVLMAGSCTFAAIGSLWSLWSKLGVLGLILFAIFIIVVVATRGMIKKPAAEATEA